jgi:3-polyprenyl-4-hydroxybenzoate decarboxylase
MTEDRRVVGLIAGAAGGIETLRVDFIEPALRRGWRVAVTLTPTAGAWLANTDEREKIEQCTGLPIRYEPRLPDEASPHPPVDCYVVAPASANTVAKLALGIADNHALTAAGEAIGDPDVPVIVFPRVNAAHARHPAWEGHLAALRYGGVHLVYGEHVWPLYEPRSAPPNRTLPWDAILDLVEEVLSAR